MDTKFRLNNKEDIEKFEKNLDSYKKETGFEISTYFNLYDWFDFCKKNEEYGGKIFSAILDLKLSFALTEISYLKSRINWNTNFANKEDSNFSVLENTEHFNNCLYIMNHLTSFVFLYRATWDKLLGLLILVELPTEYGRYRRSKIRKKKFRNLCRTHDLYPEQFLDSLFGLLEEFDRKYRTPEAHATGSMRNWVLNPSDNAEFSFENPNYEITRFWNDLIVMIDGVEKDILNTNC